MQLLDGAMGTELRRRGFELRPPLFASAAVRAATDSVVDIHRDYLEAGAQILTTNSFMLGAPDTEASDLIALAHAGAELARRAIRAHGGTALVAGNLGPHHDRAPAVIEALARALLDAGVDLLLLETLTSSSWGAEVLRGLTDLEAPLWLGCAWRGGRFLDGSDAAPLLDAPPPALLAANCFELESLRANLDALEALAERWGVDAIGVWPNLSRSHDGDYELVAHDDESFALALWEAVRDRPRVRVIGSCCGSTPATTAALARMMKPRSARA